MKILKRVLIFLAVIILLPLAFLLLVPQPEIPIETQGKYKLSKVILEETEYQGVAATAVEYKPDGLYEWAAVARMMLGLDVGQPNSIALLADSGFADGVIEVDIAGTVVEGASSFARGFAGIAFRVSPDLRSYEAVYLRPANGRADDPVRRKRVLQYISHPDFHFDVSRKTDPGKYETGADIGLDEWVKLRIEVDGSRASVSVNGAPALDVNDMKLGPDRTGGIALWVNPGSRAYFANLSITPKEPENRTE